MRTAPNQMACTKTYSISGLVEKVGSVGDVHDVGQGEVVANNELLASKMGIEHSQGDVQLLVGLGNLGVVGLGAKHGSEVQLVDKIGGSTVVVDLNLDPVLDQAAGLGITAQQRVGLVVGSGKVGDDGA